LFSVCSSLRQPVLFAAPGLHPCYIEQHQDAHLDELDSLLQTRADIVAVGEIGLDYYVSELKAPALKARQAEVFRAQLRLAATHGKPVLLHVRKAHQEVLAILKAEKFSQAGIVHAYSGGIEEARLYAKLGFKLGIGGPVTYEQARRLRTVVGQMPLEALVLETDAPDMVPQPHRRVGERHTRNSPEFLPAVAVGIASVKQLPLDVVLATTRASSMEVLRLAL
jgi:TatD DNase family protein